MASTEMILLSDSDDDFKEPPRKPIGWNYQLTPPTETKAKPRPNGTSAPASCRSVEEVEDDLEIIEVKVEPKSKVMPTSSSRTEIRKQVRNLSQSTIKNFFSNKKEVEEDTNERRRKKEKEKTSSEEEENDRSAASLEEFFKRWEDIKISKDDEKIRDKVWKYYHLAETSYTHSKKFIQIIEKSTRKLTVDNIYVLIKDILDCLKQYKDIPYKEKGSGTESAGASKEGTPPPIEGEDSKTNLRLRKVEKKMKEVANKIKELEDEEVDLDDEDNSVYLIEDRLKRQFAKLHDYYCRIANCSTATGRPTERKFKYRGSRWMEINKRITAWVNKHKDFPDYVDILNLVKKVTKDNSLPFRPETVRVQAQEIFRDVGMMLKSRRESDDLYSIYSYIEDDGEDPALQNQALDQQLNENEKVATDNLNKVFQEYVEKDNQVKGLADCATEEDKTSKSSVKDSPSRTAECLGETSKKEGDDNVKDNSKEENSVKNNLKGENNVKKNRTENDRKAEYSNDKEVDIISEMENDTSDNEEENIISDMENVTSSDDDDDDDDDDDTYSEEDGEAERQDTKEQNSCEGGKAEQELDDDDETDDDLKVVLASACVEEEEEEEEEDSEEDIPVYDIKKSVEVEGTSGNESSVKDSVLCMDVDSSDEKSSKKSIVCLDDTTDDDNSKSVLSLDDDSLHLTATTTTTIQNNCTDHLSTISITKHNSTNQQPLTTTTVVVSPNASVNTSTITSSIVTSKPQQKRQLENTLSPCKRLCIMDS